MGGAFNITIPVGGGTHTGPGETLSYVVAGIGATITQDGSSATFTITPLVSGTNTMLAIVSDGCQIATRQFTFTSAPVFAGYVGVCPGTFEMGETATPHTVTLTKGFYMKVTEVTQGEWKVAYPAVGIFPAWNPSGKNNNSCDTCPVEQVTWYESAAYANKLSLEASPALTPCYTFASVVCGNSEDVATDYAHCMNAEHWGINSATVTVTGGATPYGCTGYRLQTESEWEYAARAGTTGDHYGEELSPPKTIYEIAWSFYTSDGTTHPVGMLPANQWGLYDMLGNVWEWTWDWYAAEYMEPYTDPTGPLTGLLRTLRGGCWSSDAWNTRAVSRNSYGVPGYRYDSAVGLRPVRSL